MSHNLSPYQCVH